MYQDHLNIRSTEHKFTVTQISEKTAQKDTEDNKKSSPVSIPTVATTTTSASTSMAVAKLLTIIAVKQVLGTHTWILLSI